MVSRQTLTSLVDINIILALSLRAEIGLRAASAEALALKGAIPLWSLVVQQQRISENQM